MKRWLKKRGLVLSLLVAAIAPPLITPNEIKADWRFWVPYSVVLLATAVVIASRFVDDVWSLFNKR